MAFTSATRFLVDFSEAVPTNRITGAPMTVQGSDLSVTLLDDGLGYSMKQSQNLRDSSIDLSISTAMTIGFWLKSTNPGFAEDPTTGALSPLQIAVMDIIDVNSVPLVVMHETTSKGGQNMLTVNLDDGDYTATSPSYSVDTWHHFWITYDGASGDLKIFIDGEQVTPSTTGALPASLSASTGTIGVNRAALISGFDKTLNQGVIDDIVILNGEDDATSTIQKVINYSLDFAFDTTFMNNEEVDQGFVFDDPDVFRLTAAQDDSTSIFASRSDGKILEGSPAMWQARRKFRNENEVDSLTIFGSGFERKNGFLEISGNAVVSI